MADRAHQPMSKRWMITVWEEHAGLEWTPVAPDAVYSVWGKDAAPETGRVHWHVYARYATKKRTSTVLNTFPDASWAEVAEHPEGNCRDYVWKRGPQNAAKAVFLLETGPETGVFNGDEGKQGRRSDLDDIADKCKTGTPLRSIAEDHPSDFIRYHSGIQALHAQVAPRPSLERANLTVILLWGGTGTGKTHRFMHAYPNIYSVNPGRDPWGMYRGEKEILFDEFNWEKWTIQEMNRFLDKWRLLLDARYNDRYAEWELVAICANTDPVTWYPNADYPLFEAFKRRIRGHCFFVRDQKETLDQITTGLPSPM